MTPTPKKKGISPQTFNMLVFAALLIVAICLIVLFHHLFSNAGKETEETADTNEAPLYETTTYYLNNLYAGPLALCSPVTPWTEAQVDAVFSTLTPLMGFSYGEEEPYSLPSNRLFAKGEAVMALRSLAIACPSTLSITQAYLSFADAGSDGGTSPFHTGYTFSIALPAQADSTWLQNNAHRFGFVFCDQTLQYVSPPHAYMIWSQGMDVETYVTMLQEYTPAAPLQIDGGACTYATYYIPANHGTASITLTQEKSFHVTGNARDGFIITLLVFSPSL